MTQRYFSKRYVDKLKEEKEWAENMLASATEQTEKDGAEIKRLKEELEEANENYRTERTKRYEMQRERDERLSKALGKEEARDCFGRAAMRRAHKELQRVKADEKDVQLLQRALGNAQGILAGAIDQTLTNGEEWAQPISYYPEQEKAEAQARNRYRG